MEFLPIFLSARERRVVVVGDGQMADAKCRGVLKTSARVTVFTDNPSEQALAWSRSGDIALRAGVPGSRDFTGVALVYAAHHSDQVNDQIAVSAREKGALVNVLDRTNACDFITPAIVDRDPVVVAIGTEGSAPVLARQIKADFEAMLPADLGRFARLANAFRARVRALPEGLARRKFWRDAFKPERMVAGTSDEVIEREFEALLERHIRSEPEQGSIAFVGAGPGLSLIHI